MLCSGPLRFAISSCPAFTQPLRRSFPRCDPYGAARKDCCRCAQPLHDLRVEILQRIAAYGSRLRSRARRTFVSFHDLISSFEWNWSGGSEISLKRSYESARGTRARTRENGSRRKNRQNVNAVVLQGGGAAMIRCRAGCKVSGKRNARLVKADRWWLVYGFGLSSGNHVVIQVISLVGS